MSLPGDRDINTDPQDEPNWVRRMQNMTETLRRHLSGAQVAVAVLEDENASEEAKELAMRWLRFGLQGYEQILSNINDVTVQMQEEIDTLSSD